MKIILTTILLAGCAAIPQPAPDLNPAHASMVTKQSFAQATPESVTAPNPATITLLPFASVVLDWTPPTNVDGCTFNVYCGTESGVYSNLMNVADATATVSNLTASQTYYFAVTAVSPDGIEGDFSNEFVWHAPQWVLIHFPETTIAIQSSPDLVHWVDRPDAVQTNGDWLLRAQPEIATN
jgi:hypothetical protein